MEKKVTGVVRPGRVKIPADLLKKFQAETKGPIELRPGSAPGIMVFPEEILAKLGYGNLAKAGFEVLIVPRAE